jgi:hypothetical protein
MPEWSQNDLSYYRRLIVNFLSQGDVDLFEKITELLITHKTKSVAFPSLDNQSFMNKRYSGEGLDPRYPIYIISKGRYERPYTARALDKINVPYHIVVEPKEVELYQETIAPEKIIPTDFEDGFGTYGL